ncbi:hypothetical protein MPRS_21070 [Mycobacterium paraseoulense]|nr:hypothetical protein MPRS_21070 [Mycobacterium paraseoulense]
MNDRVGLMGRDEIPYCLGVQQIGIGGDQRSRVPGGDQLPFNGEGVVAAQIHRDDGAFAVQQDLRATFADLSECAGDQNGGGRHRLITTLATRPIVRRIRSET